MTTDPTRSDSSADSSTDTESPTTSGGGQIGLGTDPSGTAGTVDRTGDVGATSSDNPATPFGSLGGGINDDDR
ncbi:hypothetical protein V3W47_01440 [Deinococcus sp. YIM 134068]|uniref:hypothetical protein n=1 Tax=Deinococcus lichenicola TaxID=3118910 RepID=UPI002F93190C